MANFNVYVVEQSYRDYSIEREIVSSAGGSLFLAQCKSEDDIIRQCKNAHALLLRQTPVGNLTFRNLKNLRVVSRYGVGFDNVDVMAATRRGVLVTIVPDYCVGEVADHTIALLMAAIRRIPLRDRLVRKGVWDITHRKPVHRTDGRIFGMVGYGKNAREVRRRLSGFPFRFVACDPYVDEDVFTADNTGRLDFQKLVMASDYVSLHVPLSQATHHLFDLPVFRRMRRGAILINTSRGPVINLKALSTALEEGYISGAALDVYEDEPFDIHSQLRDMDSVILSDHAAWYSEESQKELQRRTVLEAVRYLCGMMPENPVNPEITLDKIIQMDKRKDYGIVAGEVWSKLSN
jgi:D-3-phosphoglycerate dehydrogenase